jgi:hypothetical protein
MVQTRDSDLQRCCKSHLLVGFDLQRCCRSHPELVSTCSIAGRRIPQQIMRVHDCTASIPSSLVERRQDIGRIKEPKYVKQFLF